MTHILYVSKNGEFTRAAVYSTYRDAVLCGQDIAGYGNFYIETGNHVPSREEQLLVEGFVPRHSTRPRANRISAARQAVLDSI